MMITPRRRRRTTAVVDLRQRGVYADATLRLVRCVSSLGKQVAIAEYVDDAHREAVEADMHLTLDRVDPIPTRAHLRLVP